MTRCPPAARVLVVEDDRVFAALVVEMLEGDGYQAQSVSDGVQALRTMSAAAPPVDVVLCDVLLSGHHGAEVEAEARTLTSGATFVFMSGSADPAVLDRLPRTSALLHKPFGRRQLLETMATATADGSPSTPEAVTDLRERGHGLRAPASRERTPLRILLTGTEASAIDRAARDFRQAGHDVVVAAEIADLPASRRASLDVVVVVRGHPLADVIPSERRALMGPGRGVPIVLMGCTSPNPFGSDAILVPGFEVADLEAVCPSLTDALRVSALREPAGAGLRPSSWDVRHSLAASRPNHQH